MDVMIRNVLALCDVAVLIGLLCFLTGGEDDFVGEIYAN